MAKTKGENMAKTKSFEVQARLNLWVSTTIPATSLEDAVAKSKDLKEVDFVEIRGEFIDGECRVTGLFES